MAFQRSQWNALINQVNSVRASPPSNTDCEPLPPIDEVPAGTIWGRSHITQVQNALAETCGSISFSEPQSGLWDQGILNEISGQLGSAWCDCEDDCDPHSEENVEWELFTQGVEVFSNCAGRAAPAQLPASSFIGDKQLEPGKIGRLWIITARRTGFPADERARGRVACSGELEDPISDNGIFDATGITVFCTGSCSDPDCQAAIQDAENDLGDSIPATYFLSIMTVSAECMPECPPV